MASSFTNASTATNIGDGDGGGRGSGGGSDGNRSGGYYHTSSRYSALWPSPRGGGGGGGHRQRTHVSSLSEPLPSNLTQWADQPLQTTTTTATAAAAAAGSGGGPEPGAALGVDAASRIFCNRSLNMSAITAVGFDMDYTLAMYKPETFEVLAYTETCRKLVEAGAYTRPPLSSTSALVYNTWVPAADISNMTRHKLDTKRLTDHSGLS
jgi:hypothetical protein